MSPSETCEIGYAPAKLKSKFLFQIFIAVVCLWIAIDNFSTVKNLLQLALAAPAAPVFGWYGCRDLYSLLFDASKAIVTIGPDGVRDVRLGPDFVAWSEIERFDHVKPSAIRMISMMILTLVASLAFETCSNFTDEEESRILLCLHSRGRKTVIETSGLTISKQRLLDMLKALHGRYAPLPVDARS